MKNLKKLASLLLALVMVFSLATTAFAAPNGNEHTITITNTKSGHSYEAYRVFEGDFENGKLVDIEWSDGVDTNPEGGDILSALKDDTTLIAGANTTDTTDDVTFGSLFTAAETAEDVANIISAETFTASQKDIFAQIVGQNLDTCCGYSEETKGENSSTYVINVTGDGYYLVKDADDSLTGVEEDAYTKYILQVCDDVRVAAKADNPELEKKIVEEDNSEVVANTKDIGDTVTYKLTSKVPEMDGYNKYFFIVHDTMSNGLTFDDSSVKVTIGGVELDNEDNVAYEVVTTGLDDDCTFEIVFKNFIQYKDDPDTTQVEGKEGQPIVITYSAIINENAEIGVNGNTNTANLEYSDNPNVDYEGDPENPDRPKPTEPTGETPDDTVITYTTEIKLIKVDKNDHNKTLTGAKFSIEGISSKVKVINDKMYVPYGEEEADVEGNVWYRLKDGTYTQQAPVYVDDENTTAVNEKTSDSYDIPEDATEAPKYKLVEVLTTTNVEEEFTAEGWVDANGVITFTGLGEGTYTITELVAPEGYNLLKEAITVVVTSNVATITEPVGPEGTTVKVTWTAKDGTGENAAPYTVTDGVPEDGETAEVAGIVEIIVENTSGTELPSTGGMGTTLFYVFGGIMVLAAVVLLITKKRMGAAE